MDKITCVIDTCSFIYMQIPTIAESSKNANTPNATDKTLFDLFVDSNVANIKVTKEIIDEIKDPKKKVITKYNSHYASLFNNAKYKFKHGRLNKFHEGIFNNSLFNLDGNGNVKTEDLGEKINLAATIDLFLDEGKRNLVFLSDDFKAQSNKDIISEISSAFRMCLYWDTCDVIFFLYLTGKKNKKYSITSNQAESFIDDIFSHKIAQSYKIITDRGDYSLQNEVDLRTRRKIEEKTRKEIESLKSTFNTQKGEVLKRFEILKKI